MRLDRASFAFVCTLAVVLSLAPPDTAAVDAGFAGAGRAYASTEGTLAPPPAIVDAGFESGAEGTVLTSPPWTASGVPQRREYDGARAKAGSQSAWIQGAAAGSNAGVVETLSGGMAASGAEIRAWVYFDTTTNSRLLEDYAPGLATADRATMIQFAPDGTIKVYTDRAGGPSGYPTGAFTTVGTYSTGWTEIRLVFDFPSQTYQLSTRTQDATAWVTLKAAGATSDAIPFRGTNAIHATHGTLWRGLGAGQLWVDELLFSNDGIADPVADTAAPVAPANLSATDRPWDQGGAIALAWAAASDDVGVAGYKVYRGTDSGALSPYRTLPATTTCTDAGAVTGTRYYYAVSAVDAAGNESSRSAQAWAVAADDLAPVVPAGLSATGGAERITLTWTANTEGDLSSYGVYRDGLKLAVQPAGTATYTDAGLADGAYSYQVTAVDTHGNESTRSATVVCSPSAVPPSAEGTLVDDGFESGSDGATLASPPWTASGVPQRREYDTARAKAGTRSAWIQGAAAGSNAGVWEAATGGMTSNGAEVRAWVYLDTTTHSRLLEDYAAGVAVAERATSIQFAPDGTIKLLTDRAGNPNGYATGAYTTVGTYAAGWTQLRLVFDFASQTYTLSTRTTDGAAWRQLKAAAATGFGIPFRGTNAITTTHGTLWRGLGAGQLWLDELRYADEGMKEDAVTLTVTGLPAGGTAAVYRRSDGVRVASAVESGGVAAVTLTQALTDVFVMCSTAEGRGGVASAPMNVSESTSVAYAEIRDRPRRGRFELCFDDGELGVYEHGQALLREFGVQAVLPIITTLPGSEGSMTWSQIASLAADGHVVASHSRTHAALTALTPEQLASEVDGSHADLVARGYQPESFVYPNGAQNEAVKARVRERYARAAGALGYNGLPPADAFLLARQHAAVSPGGGLGLAATTGYIDRAASNGEWLIFLEHGVATRAELYDPETWGGNGFDHSGYWTDTDALRAQLAYLVSSDLAFTRLP